MALLILKPSDEKLTTLLGDLIARSSKYYRKGG